MILEDNPCPLKNICAHNSCNMYINVANYVNTRVFFQKDGFITSKHHTQTS